MNTNEIFKTISDSRTWILPEKCTFLLADTENSRLLIVKKNSMNYSSYQSLFTFSDNTSYFRIKNERGRILGGFCSLETIIDELFVIKLGGFTSESQQKIIRSLTAELSLAKKISILKSEGVITEKLKELLWGLKDFRNQIAHEWILRELKYRGKVIIDDKALESGKLKKTNVVSFQRIEKDFHKAWHQLLEVYANNQQPVSNWIKTLI